MSQTLTYQQLQEQRDELAQMVREACQKLDRCLPAGGQFWLVREILVHRLRHAPSELGRHAAGMEGKALDSVVSMIDLNELTKAIDRMFRRLVVRGPRHQKLRADR